MHYYDFNIKSYQAATNHLSNDEDLAYRRLLDFYYDTEKPIPNDIPLLARRLRLGSDVILIVLKEFFLLSGNEWKHEYCDTVIYKYSAYLLKQQENGRKGGRNKGNTNNDKEPTANPEEPTANPTLSQQETINNKPITINHIKESKKEILSLIQTMLPDVDPQVVSDFEKHRRNKKAAITKTALNGIRREATKAGITLEAALIECCERGWVGFKADWYNKTDSPHKRKQKFNSSELMYGMDGYGNKIKGNDDELRIIDVN